MEVVVVGLAGRGGVLVCDSTNTQKNAWGSPSILHNLYNAPAAAVDAAFSLAPPQMLLRGLLCREK